MTDFFFAFFFSQNGNSWFYSRSLGYSHFLHCSSHNRYRFHLTERALSQIRYWLVTPTSTVPQLHKQLHSSSIYEGVLLYSLSSFIAWWLIISFDRLQSTSWNKDILVHWAKTLQTQLDFSMSSELCRCLFQDWGLAISL